MTISIVLYGRNDNYGYNLHKRAALSLNCMAEVLTDSSDEILFVDYNTPDDFPTFPEAIQDTLTQRARDILRIFRVRPRIHQRYKSKTHLVALEPIARNVAIRRSCPANRWVLSTNTDMIFVPRTGISLSAIARDLAPGFYHAPRIEIPEVLWESLDRHAPAEIITTVREWGSALHLNEIILGAEYILYDGPGDFQLFLRDDLFANCAFHEEMLLGWHVDSNIAKRMFVKYGTVGDLGKQVYGYHCDHTRQVTPAHSHTRLQNDWRRFCDEVDCPGIPEQADTWGCVNDEIEEVRLVTNPANIYVQALRAAVGPPLTEPQVSKYTHETYNKIDYDPRHVVPFLADMFASMPKSANVAWYGAQTEMLCRFATVWDKLGFSGKILADPELIRSNDLAQAIEFEFPANSLNRADAFVFDFGGLPGLPGDVDRNRQLSERLLRRLLGVVRDERRRSSAGLSPRRVIAVNAINNQFERLINGYVAAAATPCATHMRHGFVLAASSRDDWLPALQVGRAGLRVGERIDSDPCKLGAITYGGYKYLDAGCYRLTIAVELAAQELVYGDNAPCIVIQIHSGAKVLGVFLLRRAALSSPDHEFYFTVPATAAEAFDGLEARIITVNRVALSIRALIIEPVPEARAFGADVLFSPPLALKIENWLPFLSLGPLGRSDECDILAQSGPSAFVAFGPYWALPAGYYEMTINIVRESDTGSAKGMLRADVMTGDQQLVAANFRLDGRCTGMTIRLPFEMRGSPSDWQQIETRIWSSGVEPFRIRSLSVKPVEQSQERDLIPFLLIGEAGRRVSCGISNVEGRSGLVAFSPTIGLKPGPYRLAFAVEAARTDDAQKDGQLHAIAKVKYGAEILLADKITSPGQTKEQRLEFGIPSKPNCSSGLEFTLKSMSCVNITLSRLIIEPIEVHDLRNWLPFLRMGQSVHAVEDGVVVSEGREEFAVYGPFWTLPAGRYEMRALVVPHPQSRETSSVAAAEVVSEEGARVITAGKWRLDQYTEAATPVEFRLPFSLSNDLPAASRTIETRIFTPGDANFRILSLTVTARSDRLESNWFPYLLVEERGVHTGGAIKGREDKPGYVACTPPMAVLPGHYKLIPDIGIDGATLPDEEMIAFEVWSGSDLIAVEPVSAETDQPLEFVVADKGVEGAIELRVFATAPRLFSMRGLSVERVSDDIEPPALPGMLRLKDWLPFLRVGAAGCPDGRAVLARRNQEGYVVYGPFWTLPAGRYEMVVALELDEAEASSAGRWKRLKTVLTALTSFPKLLREGGADVILDGRQLAKVDGFTIESPWRRSASAALPFEIAVDDVKRASRLETRVWSTGRRGFGIRSVAVRKIMPNDSIDKQRRDQSHYGFMVAKIAGKLRALVNNR